MWFCRKCCKCSSVLRLREAFEALIQFAPRLLSPDGEGLWEPMCRSATCGPHFKAGLSAYPSVLPRSCRALGGGEEKESGSGAAAATLTPKTEAFWAGEMALGRIPSYLSKIFSPSSPRSSQSRATSELNKLIAFKSEMKYGSQRRKWQRKEKCWSRGPKGEIYFYVLP